MNRLSFASTFLSHSHQDKAFVELVAQALWRRGVVVWLDQNDLAAAMSADLSHALAEAVRRQASVTIFLSEAALKSSWVNDELAVALQQPDQDLLPVFLGDPVQLVRSHDELKRRNWLRPDGKGVRINYEQVNSALDATTEAQRIAEKIALRLYDRLQFRQRREAVICLDQRGQGNKRSTEFPIPGHQQGLDAPALVFRTNLQPRNYGQTLHGDDLTEGLRAMEWALGQAFGNSRGGARKIYLSGEAQLALPFWVGQHFNRSNNAFLYCYNSKDGEIFSNEGQSLTQPLTTGNAHCEKSHALIAPIAPGEQFAEAALLLVKESYLADAIGWLQAQPQLPRIVWVESEQFADSPQAMRYVADVVALLSRLKLEHGLRHIRLFLDLPFGVVPLLAANLLYSVPNFELMEFRRDLWGTGATPSALYFPVRRP
jgi:hypothetical protein